MKRLVMFAFTICAAFSFSFPLFSLCPQTGGMTYCIKGADHMAKMAPMPDDAECDDAKAHDDCRYEVDQLTPDEPALITAFVSTTLHSFELVEPGQQLLSLSAEPDLRARPGPIYILKESFLI